MKSGVKLLRSCNLISSPCILVVMTLAPDYFVKTGLWFVYDTARNLQMSTNGKVLVLCYVIVVNFVHITVFCIYTSTVRMWTSHPRTHTHAYTHMHTHTHTHTHTQSPYCPLHWSRKGQSLPSSTGNRPLAFQPPSTKSTRKELNSP